MNSKNSSITQGTLRVHRRGFGFLIPDDRSLFPLDIFIPKRAIEGAVDGDSVEVEINPCSSSEKGPEGRVLHILRRGRSHVAGTIAYIERKKTFYAYVPLLGEGQYMRILPSDQQQLQIGDRIIIHVLDWGSDRRDRLGKMSAYLGHIDDPSCDIRAAIEEFELDDAFSQATLSEAKAFGTSISQAEGAKREDLRKLECLTIDPDTAKDFDDALSIQKDRQGNYHLGIHIADVSHYVKPGTSLDDEARARCNSVYLPGTVLPMLPHELSSHLCSLKPHVNRLAVSVLLVLDASGELLEYRIVRSVIRSKKRFTYKEAKAILDGKKQSPFKRKLKLMQELCARLKEKRAERGSIEFALPDISITLDPKGMPKNVEIVEYDISHQLVEEFMLKANEVVATHLYKQGKPLTYRIHEEPNPENMKEFAATASALGFDLSEEPDAEGLQRVFDQARQSPFGQFLATQFIRSMKLASYSTQNIGHYGLGLEYYTHFTSPIRRYIDLVVHRLLFDPINPKENFEQVAVACSEKERLSSRAENSVISLKKIRLLHDIQQKKPKKMYDAVVTYIKPFGFAFELSELLFEGFIAFTDIRRQGRRHVQTGDHIQVTPVTIDIISREVEWQLR